MEQYSGPVGVCRSSASPCAPLAAVVMLGVLCSYGLVGEK